MLNINFANEIQSWIAVRSFAVEDANPLSPIIDANELAEFVTEVFKKLEGSVVVPTNSVTLTCEQLLTVLQYGAPDLQIERTEYSDEQMETEMSIVWLEDGHSGAGYYAYYTEYPEEGSIRLGDIELEGVNHE